MFKTITWIGVIHVPYKGRAFALTAGDLRYMVKSIETTLPHINARKIGVLALTCATRSPMLPNARTVAESRLPGVEVTSWNGIVGSAGTSGEIVIRLNGEIRQALATKDFVEVLANLGATLSGFSGLVARQFATWVAVATKACAKVD